MKRYIFFAIAVILIGSMIPLSTALAGSASISISGPKNVEAGKTYTYTITLSGSDISSAMVTSISTSGIFSGSGSGFEIGSGGENTSGSKSVDVIVTVSSSASPGDTGTISASGQFGYWNEDMSDVLTGNMSKSLTATVVEPTPDPTPTSTVAPTAAPTTAPTATSTTAPTTTATVRPSTTTTPKPSTTPIASVTPTPSLEPSETPSATETVEVTPSPTPEKPLEWPDVEDMVAQMSVGSVLNVNMQGKTEIPISVLTQLQESEGTIEINFGDYTCTIDSSTLNNLPDDLETLDLGMSMVKDDLLSQEAGGFDTYQLHFNYHGELPGKFTYTFYASENQPGDTLYLYYSYEQAGIIEGMQSAIVDEDGYVSFEVYHCSSYFVSDKIVESAMNNFAGETSVETNNTPATPAGIPIWLFIVCIVCVAGLSIVGTLYFGRNGSSKRNKNAE